MDVQISLQHNYSRPMPSVDGASGIYLMWSPVSPLIFSRILFPGMPPVPQQDHGFEPYDTCLK